MSTQVPIRSVASCIILEHVSWQTYCTLCDVDLNRHVRMTYDRGTLFLTLPSRLHERIGKLISQMDLRPDCRASLSEPFPDRRRDRVSPKNGTTLMRKR
jgi:hypothetical protein